MKKLRLICAASALLSAALLAAALLLPPLVTSGSQSQTLERLRNKAASIRQDFQHLLDELQKKKQALAASALSAEPESTFASLERLGLRQNIAGAAFYGLSGRLETWLGNVLDLEALFLADGPGKSLMERGRSLVVVDKASVYLVAPQKKGVGTVLHYRLLSFNPQFQSPYLSDYQFLKPSLRRGCDIDFWDFREDLSGFEKIFTRHKDEYIGQPRGEEGVSSLIFPLRLEDGAIAATVTLTALAPGAARARMKETGLHLFFLSIFLSGVLLLIMLGRTVSSAAKFRRPALFLFLLVLIALRLLLLVSSRYGVFQTLSVFSPASLAFRSWVGLTRSPADLFITSFFIFIAAAFLSYAGRSLRHGRKKHLSRRGTAFFILAVSAVGLGLLYIYHIFLRAIVFHSNINLLRFVLTPPFVLIHLSFLCLALTFGIVLFRLFRFSGLSLSRLNVPSSGHHFFLAVALIALVVVVSLNIHTRHRNESLVQNTLKNTILSQEEWASFFLQETMETLDKNKDSVLAAFHAGQTPEAARRLWEKTAAARFNWYSSLEIISGQDKTVSRFALNVPQSFRPSASLPRTPDWAVSGLSATFIGREKEFLVGYRDWYEGDRHLGRTIVSLSLDYDLLPFLYSANPYFELLRVHSLPSLEQLDLGFVVFDEEGKIVFNPHHLASGLPAREGHSLWDSPEGRWIRWKDKGRMISVFCFPHGEHHYGLFLPDKNLFNLAAEFIKLFVLYGLILGLPGLLAALLLFRPKIRTFLRSYSNRVYASFLAIALIPLLLLTVFTRDYFTRVFARQFTRAAEADAAFTRNVLKDFLYLQKEEKSIVIPPPEDLVLWISSAIGTDVNLFQNGRLVSSSRREFFDSGLLPELMDGDLHHRFQTEASPFLTQRRKIGKYSFSTLTIPLVVGDSELHISLPFPFEHQEIARAAGGLIEFLILAAAFFGATVAFFARSLGSAIVTPIRKLLGGTQEVSLGNLEISLSHKPDDEMKTLFNGFNAMVQSLKQHQQELADMSQKAAWAEMARRVAHEVKNPLTPIQLSAEHLLRVYEDGKVDFEQALRQSVSYITSEVENLRKIAQEFLEISRESALRKEPTDIREVVKETLAPYKKILTDRFTIRESYGSGPLLCLADRSKLGVALRNFLVNALESITARGEIAVRTARHEAQAVIEIQDTGTGMRPEVLEHIFEPHFSTKPLGTGLGLPIAKKIIEDHNGSVRISSEPGRGTRVTVFLPLA